MSWLRVDDQQCLNPKVAQLTDGEYRALFALHFYASRARVGGEFASSGLRFALYVTPSGPKNVTQRQLEKFVSVGLVDKTSTGYKVHDWDEYQPKDPTAADRMKRYRERNAHRNDDVTEERNEAEPDRNSRAHTPSRPVPSPEYLSVLPSAKDAEGGQDGEIENLKGQEHSDGSSFVPAPISRPWSKDDHPPPPESAVALLAQLKSRGAWR